MTIKKMLNCIGKIYNKNSNQIRKWKYLECKWTGWMQLYHKFPKICIYIALELWIFQSHRLILGNAAMVYKMASKFMGATAGQTRWKLYCPRIQSNCQTYTWTLPKLLLTVKHFRVLWDFLGRWLFRISSCISGHCHFCRNYTWTREINEQFPKFQGASDSLLLGWADFQRNLAFVDLLEEQ